jgi:hypothetical protein
LSANHRDIGSVLRTGCAEKYKTSYTQTIKVSCIE